MLQGGAPAGGTPFALLLRLMVRDARGDVELGVKQLRAIIRRHPTQRWLRVYVREAVRQLYRSYVALAGEVTFLGGPGAGSPTGLECISRRELIHRVHQTGGNFSLIDTLCRSLRAMGAGAAGAHEALAVLSRWGNREVHLFRMLVPLANYAEELRADVASAHQAEPSEALVDACLRNAHHAMAPVFRELSAAASTLQRFAREADAAPPRVSQPVEAARARTRAPAFVAASRSRTSGPLWSVSS